MKTNTLILTANQWTGFHMIGTSVMNQLRTYLDYNMQKCTKCRYFHGNIFILKDAVPATVLFSVAKNLFTSSGDFWSLVTSVIFSLFHIGNLFNLIMRPKSVLVTNSRTNIHTLLSIDQSQNESFLCFFFGSIFDCPFRSMFFFYTPEHIEKPKAELSDVFRRTLNGNTGLEQIKVLKFFKE